MIIRKSFQYSLRPTKKQARVLEAQLEECRWLYNELLSQRKLAYEEIDISPYLIEGIVKTCTIRRNASGGWSVSLSCEMQMEPKLSMEKSVGIDMGLETFATFSDGNTIKNPRFFKKEEKALATAQRKLSKLNKGTKERRKQGKVVAKIHERISNKRKDFCHKESKNIVDHYQYICVEDLDVKNMIQGTHLAKSITEELRRLMLLLEPSSQIKR